MARETRQQRRARRAEEGEQSQRQNAQRRPLRPAAEAPRHEPVQRAPRRFPGTGFLHEAWAELKKVEWPSQQQVITGTTVVLIACAIVGVYLYANDIVWKHVVQNFLLK